MADNNVLTFPYEDAKPRLQRYRKNDLLFEGEHWQAFNQKIGSLQYNKEYSKLKYITSNFTGLVSKVAADLLFSEPVKYKVRDKKVQAFIEGLVTQNKLDAQNYESALANSRHGDAIYKLRVGKLKPGDEKTTVIIEDITPAIYFPKLDSTNMRGEPEEQELAWRVKIGELEYLRKEIHTPGKIENKLYLLEGETIKQEVDIKLLDKSLKDTEDTKIKGSLIVHVPNWRDSSRYFGYDDYADLESLLYALNNRMTKTENILDKHSDPILALPEGVLDEKGQVKKEAFHMFEIPSEGVGTAPKPEYITWNASLESNFKHIEKLIEMLYMFSETSPDAFGMGQGQSDSGRALKLKLMRTIAKVARKRVYYDIALKQVLVTAQELAKAHKVGVWNENTMDYDIQCTKIESPELEWQDGLPIDSRESAEEEEIRLRSGNTTVADSIVRLDKVDEETANKKAAKIDDATRVEVPSAAPNTSTDPETDPEAE